MKSTRSRCYGDDDSGVLCEWTKEGAHRNFGIRVGVGRREFLQSITLLLGAPEVSAPAAFVPGKEGKSSAILLAAETKSPEATGCQITPHSYEILQGEAPPKLLGRGPRARCDSGELAEAKLIHHEALVLSKHGGDEQPGVVAWLHALAGVLRNRGKLEPAEMLCAEALALCRKGGEC